LTLFAALLDPIEGIVPGLPPLWAFHPLPGSCLLDPLLLRPSAHGRLLHPSARGGSHLLRPSALDAGGCRLATVDPPLLPGFTGYLVPLLPVPLNPGPDRPVGLDSGPLLPVKLSNRCSLSIRFNPPPSLRNRPYSRAIHPLL
jgi:hypothetical protein